MVFALRCTNVVFLFITAFVWVLRGWINDGFLSKVVLKFD